MSIESDESNIEGENPVQNFLFGGPRRDRPQRERIAVAVGEKNATAARNKVKFSENFSKLFPKTGNFLEKKLKNDDINYDELSEINKMKHTITI